MPTRCCSPPESSWGPLVRMIRQAHPFQCGGHTVIPLAGSVRSSRSGTSTFSAADSTGISPNDWR
jgi:hypothetical protein